MESKLKQKTVNGLLWGGFSSGIQLLIGIVFGIFLARILNADDYGLNGMLAIFVAIACTIINAGFSTALINKQNIVHRDYNAVFWFTFLMGTFLYIVLFFSAPLIAKFYGRPELTGMSRILFLNIFFSGMACTSHTVIFKQLMVKKQAQMDVFSLLIASCIGILLAINGFAYWAITIQTTVHICLNSILKLIVAPWRPKWSFDFSPLKQMFSFSFKLFLTNIFFQINANIFSLVLGKFYNATQLGYYSQGQKWSGLGSLFIGGMFNSVTQPILVLVNEEKDRQLLILRKLIRFGAFVSFPLLFGLALIGKEFILITIGDKWLASVPFLQLFCVWGAFGFLSTLYTNLILSKGKSDFYMYGTIALCLLQFIPILFAYYWGIYPMVISYIFVCFIGLSIWQYYLKKLIGLRLRDVLKDIFPYLTITLGCLFVAWFLTRNIQNLYILLSSKIAITALLYILIMKFSNSVMFKESMDYIRKIILSKLST
jgi:O-antigen/teichoic acid export membrane protein